MPKEIPPSTKRVELHTIPPVNARIREKTLAGLRRYHDAGQEALTERIRELNGEWDTERVLEANAAFIILIGTILTITLSLYWLILVIIVSFFLLQHAVQGWCPPLPLIRRLGVRTPEEIHDEKMAVRLMRGDFAGMENPEEILERLGDD